MADPAHPQLGLDLGPPPAPAAPAPVPPPAGTVIRVHPDVVGLDKQFDYVVPEGTPVAVGDLVRIRLGGRALGGWVVAVGCAPDPTVRLATVTKVRGRGPTPEVLALADWAARRWAGRATHFLRTASPDANVTALPRPTPAPAPDPADHRDQALFAAALAAPRAVLRLAPAEDRYRLVRAAVATPEGQALVLCPSANEAAALVARLHRDGVEAALLAGQEPATAAAAAWARARAGCTVVGTRGAAWAPIPALARVVVLDEHDEAYQGDQTPTWHGRDVAIERARRAGVPCLLVSPNPSLDALAWGELFTPGRARDRAGWPRLHVVDQRDLDPSLGPLFSPPLVALVRGPGRVLCILNRTGRVRLLACGACAELARCARCDGAVALEDTADGPRFVCGRDDHVRPPVCLACGAGRFKNLRLGVSRARDELEALAGEPVAELTAAGGTGGADTRIVIGTEAVLHRTARADAVAFLDFDQHLLAPRFRAEEQALALLGRAARVVARARQGRLLVQTRSPDHPVLLAAGDADPARFTAAEAPLRAALGLPPATALALVSGAPAAEFVAGIDPSTGVTVQGPVDGTYRLRAPDHDVLGAALAATPRPPGRLRIEVDPLGA